MNQLSVGINVLMSDEVASIQMYDQFCDLAKEVRVLKVDHISVYSTKVDDEVEIVAEGPEDSAALAKVYTALMHSLVSSAKANEIVDAIHEAGVIFREVNP